jgi:DNA-binding NarL/FixJ family response regulator
MIDTSPYAAVLAGGASYGDIARAEGIDYAAARMRCRRAGLRTIKPHAMPRAETRRRVAVGMRMRAQGCDTAAIAERLGMTPAAVRMMLLRAKQRQPATSGVRAHPSGEA